MAYQYDLDLEFLKYCKNKDLEVLFGFLSYDKNGYKRLDGKLLDSEECKLYREDYRKYWYRIAEEFQMYSSGHGHILDTLTPLSAITISPFRNKVNKKKDEKPYVKYNEVLEQKLDNLKIHYEKYFPIEIKEKFLFLGVFKKIFSELFINQKRELLLEIGFEEIELNELFVENISEKRLVVDELKFWKACKIMAEYILQKETNFSFGGSNNIDTIFILIIAGLRKINKN